MNSTLLDMVNLGQGVRTEDFAAEVVKTLEMIRQTFSHSFVKDEAHIGGKVFSSDGIRINIYPVSNSNSYMVTHYEVSSKEPGENHFKMVFMAEQYSVIGLSKSKPEKKLMPAILVVNDEFWIRSIGNIKLYA